jgi:hypothetical protein
MRDQLRDSRTHILSIVAHRHGQLGRTQRYLFAHGDVL